MSFYLKIVDCTFVESMSSTKRTITVDRYATSLVPVLYFNEQPSVAKQYSRGLVGWDLRLSLVLAQLLDIYACLYKTAIED